MTAVAHTAVIPAQPAAPTVEAITSWELVQRVQAGGQAAFAELYRLKQPVVFRYVLGRVVNRQLAEDITQDTFVKALRRIDSFTWQGLDVAAWLITIARNLVVDHWKSGRARLEVISSPAVLAVSKEQPAEFAQPEEDVLAYLTSRQLMRLLAQLRDRHLAPCTGRHPICQCSEIAPLQYEVLVCRFLHGLSVTETAAALGRNEGAVKALQYRAVRSLARLYANDQESDLP